MRNTIDVPLYCLCHMPDTRTIYRYCDACAGEYHPQCVGINTSVTDSTEFTCPKCRQQSVFKAIKDKGSDIVTTSLLYEGHFLSSGNSPIKSRLARAYTRVIYHWTG